MNTKDSNMQTRIVWRQSDSTCRDASDRPKNNDSNVIPFPARPAPVEEPATGETAARPGTLSIRQGLRGTRERVLSHIGTTNKTADLQQDAESSEIIEALEELSLIDWMIY